MDVSCRKGICSGVGLALTIATIAVPSSSAAAHPGGLAADGCHNDRKNGGRHCHRGPNAGGSTSRNEHRAEKPIIPIVQLPGMQVLHQSGDANLATGGTSTAMAMGSAANKSA